ncbi:TSUP family transporter [Streptomyces sp. NPDC048717]|uniref:TSUP family transporter n=1 Tax=Streptomyces sp. NPDC048717 TaxID=3154928 RepID=UPI0034488A29
MTAHAHDLALVGILLGAFAQSATGMGFSLVAAPLLILHLGPHQGVALTVTLATLSSAIPLVRDARHADPRAIAHLLVPTLLCTPLLAFLLRDANPSWLAVAAGAGVIAAVAALARGARWTWLAGPRGAAAAGTASALLNVVGGVGGPPIGLYAANTGWSPATTRGTLYGFFIVQNIITALSVGVLTPGPSELAALALGTAAGMLLATRLPVKSLRTAVLALSLLGGVGLIAGAF